MMYVFKDFWSFMRSLSFIGSSGRLAGMVSSSSQSEFLVPGYANVLTLELKRKTFGIKGRMLHEMFSLEPAPL